MENDQLMIYSGNANKDEKNEKGVPIMMSKEGRNALLGREATSECSIWAMFKARYNNIKVLNVYALTTENSYEKASRIL